MKCIFCKEREATLHFGDMFSFTHGGGVNCCEICSVVKQIEHAEDRAAALPALRARLRELRAEEAGL